MLTALAVSGYRSLRDVVVPLAGLNLVTGANGSGKSNLYRALRLLADVAQGRVIASLAREGGLSSTLWAGPGADLARRCSRAITPCKGRARKGPISLRLGFAGDDFGYAIDLGLPAPGAQRRSTTIPRSSARSSGAARSCGRPRSSSIGAARSSRPRGRRRVG